MAGKNKNPEKGTDMKAITGVDNNTPVTDKVIADKVIADKVIADKVIADKVIADKVIADKAIADKVIADKVIADKAGKTYIMTKAHFAWGHNKANHFYAHQKPLISKKVMGAKYGKLIDVWLEAGWIIPGSYKKQPLT